MRRLAIVALLPVGLAGGGTVWAAHVVPTAAVTAAVNDARRPDADKMRDAARRPAETLWFAGVRPGMVVGELDPGGGYYTRLLAGAVGPKGRVFALVTAAQAARPNRLSGLQASVAAYPNVTVATVPDYASIRLPRKADLFWTTENYHDFHNGPAANIAGLNRSVFANLRANGIFYVEDHSAAPGAGLGATSSVHRMDEDLAKQELTTAGFRLDAEADLLRNPSDDRAAPNGETGHFSSDRFMLKFRR